MMLVVKRVFERKSTGNGKDAGTICKMQMNTRQNLLSVTMRKIKAKTAWMKPVNGIMTRRKKV